MAPARIPGFESVSAGLFPGVESDGCAKRPGANISGRAAAVTSNGPGRVSLNSPVWKPRGITKRQVNQPFYRLADHARALAHLKVLWG
jgi:hypothetical protein